MRKTVVLACALVCLSPSTVNGQEESWVILRVKQHRIEKNTLVITLLSGQQITVPAEDIKAVAQTLPLMTLEFAASAPRSGADDYVMQKYCFDAQVKARATIIRWLQPTISFLESGSRLSVRQGDISEQWNLHARNFRRAAQPA